MSKYALQKLLHGLCISFSLWIHYVCNFIAVMLSVREPSSSSVLQAHHYIELQQIQKLFVHQLKFDLEISARPQATSSVLLGGPQPSIQRSAAPSMCLPAYAIPVPQESPLPLNFLEISPFALFSIIIYQL